MTIVYSNDDIFTTKADAIVDPCNCMGAQGAGRVMSRSDAKKKFTEQDHIEATKGIECRKDSGVIDETPMAYKDIDSVMAAQSDLVEIVHTLKQIVCVKG